MRGRVKITVERSTDSWQILVLLILAWREKAVGEKSCSRGLSSWRVEQGFYPWCNGGCSLERSDQALAVGARFGVSGWEPGSCLFLTPAFWQSAEVPLCCWTLLEPFGRSPLEACLPFPFVRILGLGLCDRSGHLELCGWQSCAIKKQSLLTELGVGGISISNCFYT